MSRFPALEKWAADAACLGTPTSWWFPSDVNGWAQVDVVPPQAAERCAACPVRRQCGAHALKFEQYGVWAGMSETQRARLRDSGAIRRTTAVDLATGGGSVNAPDLAAQLGVTKRSAYRYIAAARREGEES